MERRCMVQATARGWGVHAAASRGLSFGPPAEEFRIEFDMACRASATQIALSTARTKPADILATCDRILRLGGFEHEWRLCPSALLTGLSPLESVFIPVQSNEPLEVRH